MQVATKHQTGEEVYVFNPYTGKCKKRAIVGLMYKEVKSSVTILYGFMKDLIQNEKDMFWVTEERVFETMEDMTE